MVIWISPKLLITAIFWLITLNICVHHSKSEEIKILAIIKLSLWTLLTLLKYEESCRNNKRAQTLKCYPVEDDNCGKN